jgi:hypothetical protein
MRLLEVSQARAKLDRHQHGTRGNVGLSGALMVAATLAITLGAHDAIQIILVMLAVIQVAAVLGREAKAVTLRDSIDAAERAHLAAELTRHQRDLAQAQQVVESAQAEPETEHPQPVGDPQPPQPAPPNHRARTGVLQVLVGMLTIEPGTIDTARIGDHEFTE